MTDDAVLKAIDEGAGADGQIIALRTAPVEGLSVLFAGVIDVGDVSLPDIITVRNLLVDRGVAELVLDHIIQVGI